MVVGRAIILHSMIIDLSVRLGVRKGCGSGSLVIGDEFFVCIQFSIARRSYVCL